MTRYLHWVIPRQPSYWPRRRQSVRASHPRDYRPLLERLEDRQLLSITVNTLVDELDGSIVDGDVSLRDAIVAAAPAETINFSVTGTIKLTLGELLIDKSVTINGPGAHLLTIDARGNDPTPEVASGDGSRVLHINDGNSVADKTVAISGLTLTGGDVFDDGGAIRNAENLTVTNSTITGNVAHGTFTSYGYYYYYFRHHTGGGIWSSGSLTVSGSIVTGNTATGSGGGIISTGNLTVTGSDIFGNSSGGDGGGIHGSGSGTNAVTNSRITRNSAGGSGGGAFGNNLTVTGSTISGNSAQLDGGGLASLGNSEVSATKIAGNSAGGSGGGILGGNLTLTVSTITGNSATSSGGGISSNGNLAVTASTIGDNTSGGSGGGVHSTGTIAVFDGSTLMANSAGGEGGGLSAATGNLTIINSTVSTNEAVGHGGGIYIDPFDESQATASLSYSTIANNRADVGSTFLYFGGGLFARAGALRFDHSIVADNFNTMYFDTRSDLTGFLGVTIDAQWSLFGHNANSGLVEAPVGSPDAKGNLIGGAMGGAIDPLLGPLARNGGPTMSHALLAGSPAVDAGRPTAVPGASGVPLNDQRRNPFTRVFNGDGTGGARIDIGAYERQSIDGLNLVVDTLLDESDGDYSPGDLSLREAIELARGSVLTTDSITFATALTGGGPATIMLTLGELAITDSLSISGPGAGLLTINAYGNDPTPGENNGDGSRVFNIDDGDYESRSNVAISGLKLTGGDVGDDFGGGAIRNHENLTITGSTISGNSASFGSGGGVYNEYGILTIRGSTISNNSAHYLGGGICGYYGDVTVTDSIISGNSAGDTGGGIYANTLEVAQSTVSGNSAGYSGGGISGRYVTVTNSTVIDNTAGYSGGGICGIDVTVTSSTISGNSAGFAGGGLYNYYGSLAVTNSTISGNSAELGGGVYSSTELIGSRTTITSSTISGNTAESAGGGLYNAYGLTVIEFSTITGNQAPAGEGGGVASFDASYARTRVRSSIIAGNVGSDVDVLYDATNSFQSSGYNLIGIGNALIRFNQTGDQTGVTEPRLGPLTSSGGSTKTHALLPGSPAIDRGDPAAVAGVGGVPAFDQRSVPYVRVYDGDGAAGARIDIGAFELQPIASPALPGDYNQNGKVDAADYTVWRGTLGSSVMPYSSADGSGNGVIDAADYSVWKAHFGTTTAVNASAEPATWHAIAGTQPPALPGVSAAQSWPTGTVALDPRPDPRANAMTASPERHVLPLPADVVFTMLGKRKPAGPAAPLVRTALRSADIDTALSDSLLLLGLQLDVPLLAVN